MKITGKDLLEAGWEQGRLLGDALREASLLDGETKEEIISQIKTPKRENLISLRSHALKVSQAIIAETDTERDNVNKAVSQMSELSKVPVIKKLSIMPDACPAGSEAANITVGGCIEVDNAIIPSAHSADVCCSMYATFFLSDLSSQELIDKLYESTHFGIPSKDRKKFRFPNHIIHKHKIFKENQFLQGLENVSAISLGTQGDGNHFAYLGTVTFSKEALLEMSKRIDIPFVEGDNWKTRLFPNKEYKVLVTHHGSRNLGAQVYKRGLKCAETMTKRIAKNIPKTGAWIPYDSDEGKDYWKALEFIKLWTWCNHNIIHNKFIQNINSESIFDFWNPHNFVWKRGNSFYHGKGATPAWDNQIGLIPLSMGEPILIVKGSDNEKFLSFCPHGAGRNFSRTELKKYYSEEEKNQFIKKINDKICLRWYSGVADFSELPVAYKNADKIQEEIKKFDLAEILAKIEPIGCIMAGHFENNRRKKK